MVWIQSIWQISSVQSSSVTQSVWLLATPWTAARQASLSITNSQSLLKLMSVESVMPSNHLILCRPLLLLPPIPPSIRVFSNELTLRMRWPKYWNFSFRISPSNEHPGLTSFRMDWLDLLAVQGTLKSLLQHHNSKASIFQHSAFFKVQLSHPYMTTGKTTALTRRTFVGKVMSLLFNMLSRLVITFLPRSKRLLISWLQSPSTVTLESKKINSTLVPCVSWKFLFPHSIYQYLFSSLTHAKDKEKQIWPQRKRKAQRDNGYSFLTKSTVLKKNSCEGSYPSVRSGSTLPHTSWRGKGTFWSV